jgi:hypothetical protein
MKFIGKTLNYIINTTEELGMFTEKIICDILKIQFNSKRNYINADNYPFKLSQDLEMSLGNYLKSLRIKEHLGHRNDYFDFITIKRDSISIKTNISGNKICPQKIGQVSLEKFNEKTDFNFKSVAEYKKNILKNTNKMIGAYLQHLFCCDLTLSFKYDEAKVYCFQKEKKEKVSLSNSTFRFSKTLQTWNNSISASIEIDNEFRPLCEFQIHNSRNCIKCRFNLDTVIMLIENGMIQGISVSELNLKHKYQIRVIRNDMIEVDHAYQADSTDVNRDKKRKIKDVQDVQDVEDRGHTANVKTNKKRKTNDTDDAEFVIKTRKRR